MFRQNTRSEIRNCFSRNQSQRKRSTGKGSRKEWNQGRSHWASDNRRLWKEGKICFLCCSWLVWRLARLKVFNASNFRCGSLGSSPGHSITLFVFSFEPFSQAILNFRICRLPQWPVISLTSCFANVPFTNVSETTANHLGISLLMARWFGSELTRCPKS